MNKNMLALCVDKHHGQVRKFSGLPYSIHPIEVALLAREYSINYQLHLDDLLFDVGLGHDLLEDTDATEEEIINSSSEDALLLIKELTNPSKGLDLPRHQRKQIDRDHIKHISVYAKLIKLIDRTCNLNDMHGADNEFKKTYLEESQLLLECIKHASIVLTDRYIRAMGRLYRTL